MTVSTHRFSQWKWSQEIIVGDTPGDCQGVASRVQTWNADYIGTVLNTLHNMWIPDLAL